jgi:hypothetical protein
MHTFYELKQYIVVSDVCMCNLYSLEHGISMDSCCVTTLVHHARQQGADSLAFIGLS